MEPATERRGSKINKPRSLFAGLLILLVGSLAFALPNYIPGQLIVKFKTEAVTIPKGSVTASAAQVSINIPSIKELIQSQKLMKVGKVFGNYPQASGSVQAMSSSTIVGPDLSKIYKFTFSPETNISSLAEKFKQDPSVEYAEPNYIRKIFTTPNDPSYVDYPASTNQWGLFKTRLISTESGNSGWNISTGTPSVEIAIIDTGVYATHPDLMANVNTAEGWNFVSVTTAELIADGLTPYPGEDYSGPNGNFTDVHGHGTHCSGIACAVTNNGIGIAGAAWNCKIMPLKAGFAALDGSTLVGSLLDSDSSAAVVYAADHGAKVLSMSWGGTASSLIHDAINHALSKDCVLIAAAGNGNTSSQTDTYPASYAGVMAVAATNVDDTKSSYSNYGSWVGISAPGGNAIGGSPGRIWSTYPVPKGSYTWMSGTSMATPLVAGISALVRSKYPALTSAEVLAQLKNSADNIDVQNPSYIGQLGAGRINAYKALSTPAVNVLSPNGGDFFWGGNTVNITFTATADSGIKPNSLGISYSTDGGSTFPYTITSEAPVSSPYSWIWPKSFISTTVRMKVSVSDNYSIVGFGINNGNFTVVSTPPAVSILNPVGGERVTAESTFNIKYTATTEVGLAPHPISIFYSTGGLYNLITGDAYYAAGTTESYLWKTPSLDSLNVKIRIKATDVNGLASSVETPALAIYMPPSVQVLSPEASDIFAVDDPVDITFTATNDFGMKSNSLGISYSTDGGSTFPYMVTSEAPASSPYSWVWAKNINSTTVRMQVSVSDIYGNVGFGINNGNFTVVLHRDITSPVITLRSIDTDGSARAMRNGDYIPQRPSFKATVTDDFQVDPASVKLYLDDVNVGAPVIVIGSKECDVSYAVPQNLEDEGVRTHSVRVEAKDVPGNAATVEVKALKVSSGSAKISGPVISYPTVLSPLKGITSLLVYTLTADTDVSIYMIGSSGEMVWTRKFRSGEMGGRAGYNQVAFGGMSDLSGGALGNGIYTFRIVAGGSAIGTGHLVISD